MELSKSGKKRFKQKVKVLQKVLLQNQKEFLKIWHKQVNGWISEIHFRAKSWQDGRPIITSTDIFADCDQIKQSVFTVVELASAILKAIGEKAEKLVGRQTRKILEGECVKSIAMVADKCLDGSLIQHWFYQNIKY